MKQRYYHIFLIFAASLVAAGLLNGCRFSAKKSETIKAVAATEQEKELAFQSAKKFLEEIDRDNGETWNQLSQSVKASTSKTAWSAVVTSMKTACGKKLSRESAQLVFTDELPDSPPGRYCIFEIPTKFERADLTERVVLVLENDQWMVAGYCRRKTFAFNNDSKDA